MNWVAVKRMRKPSFHLNTHINAGVLHKVREIRWCSVGT
ncbi:hypothetical protein M8C21_009485 [Ambrosia artemisiifolia]|uniref:Uncharacterized protein n=1 Tax=Ambrosia artemisiifolia TaxID=4212 RepID=A0AAD5BUI9_AMBAR|nr:hypothetical protein M8C21_009485 [Ambrosia artemisiifolia]